MFKTSLAQEQVASTRQSQILVAGDETDSLIRADKLLGDLATAIARGVVQDEHLSRGGQRLERGNGTPNRAAQIADMVPAGDQDAHTACAKGGGVSRSRSFISAAARDE